MPETWKDPEGWSDADKFIVVLESTGLNTTELGAFCRERGLYPVQVDLWHQAAPASAIGRPCRRHLMPMPSRC